jgi:hypothetical protein
MLSDYNLQLHMSMSLKRQGIDENYGSEGAQTLSHILM